MTTSKYRASLAAGKYSTDAGSPFDRGGADSYYGRPEEPHHYPFGRVHGSRVEQESMTEAEIEAYRAGYHINEEDGLMKAHD